MTEVAVARTAEPSTDERAATGLPELDGMLEGGFLSGSLITLTGRPGTGKTIFGSHFLYHGAKKAKQAGMYVSMLESERSYLHNARRRGIGLHDPVDHGRRDREHGEFPMDRGGRVRCGWSHQIQHHPVRRSAGP